MVLALGDELMNRGEVDESRTGILDDFDASAKTAERIIRDNNAESSIRESSDRQPLEGGSTRSARVQSGKCVRVKSEVCRGLGGVCRDILDRLKNSICCSRCLANQQGTENHERPAKAGTRILEHLTSSRYRTAVGGVAARSRPK